jgi:hypothetical protein
MYHVYVFNYFSLPALLESQQWRNIVINSSRSERTKLRDPELISFSSQLTKTMIRSLCWLLLCLFTRVSHSLHLTSRGIESFEMCIKVVPCSFKVNVEDDENDVSNSLGPAPGEGLGYTPILVTEAY